MVENVAEILLGMDWLTKNVEQLDLRKGKVRIAGRRTNLQRAAEMRPSRNRRRDSGQWAPRRKKGGVNYPTLTVD